MSKFKVRVNGNAEAQGKPRLYFTCHPADFKKFFDKICEDVFACQNCAIYYTEDMNATLDEENLNLDLGRMNLFLVPVTFRLLNERNRAMSVDIAFAKKKKIPILPFMMETGIDKIYSLPKNFGEKQYLTPLSTDTSEIGYHKKLKNYLNSMLISDEMADRVRAAFNAYIFLSYRKKDRRYANELIRIIHAIPGCRDIAIWYDEFLVPGESWRENIKNAMMMVKEKSNLFTLLVTPNILEEYLDDNGNLKKNYVMEIEYPAARQMGMHILPVQMEETNTYFLRKKYDGIPDSVKYDDEDFTNSLLSFIETVPIRTNYNDPEHNMLIGLAYLDGIDVEIDVERGIEMITFAAEAGVPEAMDKLFNMYKEGDRVTVDYYQALKWIKQYLDYNIRKYGENNTDTLIALNNLAIIYNPIGEYDKALELHKRVFRIWIDEYGEEHPDTLVSFINLAATYRDLEKYEKAIELGERGCALSISALGEKNPITIRSLSNLATTYSYAEKYKKALELNKKVYALQLRVHGETHHDTLSTLSKIAANYGDLGKNKKTIKIEERVYKLRLKFFGANHRDTLSSLYNLTVSYFHIKKYDLALECGERVYETSKQVFGNEHPNTLLALNYISVIHNSIGNNDKAIELAEEVYSITRKTIGMGHPDMYIAINSLAAFHTVAESYERAISLYEELYALQKCNLGEDHLDTLETILNLAYCYNCVENRKKAIELYKRVYDMRLILLENRPAIKSIFDELKHLRMFF